MFKVDLDFRISPQPSHTREAHFMSFSSIVLSYNADQLVNNDNWFRDQVGWPFRARSRLSEAIVIYKFPVKCILSESWHQTKSYKGSLSQQRPATISLQLFDLHELSVILIRLRRENDLKQVFTHQRSRLDSESRD